MNKIVDEKTNDVMKNGVDIKENRAKVEEKCSEIMKKTLGIQPLKKDEIIEGRCTYCHRYGNEILVMLNERIVCKTCVELLCSLQLFLFETMKEEKLKHSFKTQIGKEIL